jgi:hypothetical protein
MRWNLISCLKGVMSLSKTSQSVFCENLFLEFDLAFKTGIMTECVRRRWISDGKTSLDRHSPLTLQLTTVSRPGSRSQSAAHISLRTQPNTVPAVLTPVSLQDLSAAQALHNEYAHDSRSEVATVLTMRVAAFRKTLKTEAACYSKTVTSYRIIRRDIHTNNALR